MSHALRMDDLPPGAVALIKEGTPSPKTHCLSSNLSPEDHSREQEKQSDDSEPNRVAEQKSVREEKHNDDIVRPVLVSLSVRVPSEIPDALVRASADRKIKRQRPSTHQDIVVEAMTAWLKENGYLS